MTGKRYKSAAELVLQQANGKAYSDDCFNRVQS